MTEPSWTTHVLAGAAWRRFGIMLLFAPVLCCAGLLIAFVALFQFFTVLASGETNPHLGGLGGELGRFASAIIAFLTYNSERPPFPFAPWPGAAARTGARTAKSRTKTRTGGSRSGPSARRSKRAGTGASRRRRSGRTAGGAGSRAPHGTEPPAGGPDEDAPE